MDWSLRCVVSSRFKHSLCGTSGQAGVSAGVPDGDLERYCIRSDVEQRWRDHGEKQ